MSDVCTSTHPSLPMTTQTFSNVPGPQTPQSLLSRPIQRIYGLANAPFALMVSGTSYNGSFSLAVCGEANVVSQARARQLTSYFEEEQGEMYRVCKLALEGVGMPAGVKLDGERIVSVPTVGAVLLDWTAVGVLLLLFGIGVDYLVMQLCR